MNVKLLKEHRKDCVAVIACKRGDWSTPWFLDTYTPAEHFLADSICRVRNDKYRGTSRWLLARCNDPNCDAEIAVMVNAIEELIQSELRRVT